MFRRSRIFRRTPRRSLALAALTVAVVLGCRPVPDADPQSPGVGGRSVAVQAQVAPGESSHSGHPADPLLRAESLRHLGPSGLAALARGLDDEDLLVRGIAVLCLTHQEPGALARHLDPAVARGPARFVWLEQRNDARADGRDLPVRVPVCEWAGAEKEPSVRSVAAAACAHEPGVDARTIERLAADPSWIVRARLAAALAQVREPEHAAVLQLLARDAHPTVRRAAMSDRPAHSDPRAGTES